MLIVGRWTYGNLIASVDSWVELIGIGSVENRVNIFRECKKIGREYQHY
jgi:hypothetical protein